MTGAHPAVPTPTGWTIDHVGIAVPDLDAGAEPYRSLGLAVHEDEEVPDQNVRVRILRAGDGWIELLAPLHEDTPVARFLASRGPGLHHLAFRVPDVDAALRDAVRSGARAIDATPRDGRAGSRVAFLHPTWSGGVLIELVQPSPARPDRQDS
ncbi:MAG: methylmalonyl-CoA epimerase [Trueperaceae bacterium]